MYSIVVMALSILLVIKLFLGVLGIILHSVGTYSLIYLYHSSTQKTQRVYLINFSITEIILNTLGSIRFIVELIASPSQPEGILKIIDTYSHKTLVTISITFYLFMILFTVDRLVKIRLSFRYRLFCNESKAKMASLVTWIFTLLLTVAAILAAIFTTFDYMYATFVYVYPTFDCLFIVIAIVTYSLIFKKYRSSRNKVKGHGVDKNNQSSDLNTTEHHGVENKGLWERMKKSFLFMPSLLIITFIMFYCVPHLTYLLVGVVFKSPSQTLFTVCELSFLTGVLLDAIIYIYYLPDVRRWLFRRFKVVFEPAMVKMGRSSSDEAASTEC